VILLQAELLRWGSAVAVLILLAWWVHARRRRRLGEFLGGRRASARLARANLYRMQLERVVLLAVATMAVAVAAADPRWAGIDPAAPPRSVVIAIDVSASMQATDAEPTRLAQAVQVADELVASLADERVGLLLFSGTTYTLAPPTRDVATVRHFLAGVTPTIASQHDPGTLMSVAIRDAAAMWTEPPEIGEIRSIILIGDGDSAEPPEAVVAEASAVGARGIRVHTIGVGTEQGSGMEIPQGQYQFGGPVVDATGVPATSRIDEAMLERVAQAGVGRYAHAEDDGGLARLRRALAPPRASGQWWRRYDLGFVFILVGLAAFLVESLLDVRLPGEHAVLTRRKAA
jgi:Ca-activated chloride channel family protein